MGGALAFLADLLLMTFEELPSDKRRSGIDHICRLSDIDFLPVEFVVVSVRYFAGDGNVGPFFRRLLFLYLGSAAILATGWVISIVLARVAILRIAGMIISASLLAQYQLPPAS